MSAEPTLLSQIFQDINKMCEASIQSSFDSKNGSSMQLSIFIGASFSLRSKVASGATCLVSYPWHSAAHSLGHPADGVGPHGCNISNMERRYKCALPTLGCQRCSGRTRCVVLTFTNSALSWSSRGSICSFCAFDLCALLVQTELQASTKYGQGTITQRGFKRACYDQILEHGRQS
jgi:hypothetical protein